MEIKDIGGEFELIKRLTSGISPGIDVIMGIGDDCAVLRYKEDRHLLVTTDMMVENDHFSLKWQTPYQVGMKLMEVNVSDIHSMGGRPTFAFLSMSLTKNTSVEFMDDFYGGLLASAALHGVVLLGGDTTHGTEYVFNLALMGEVDPSLLRLRSGAKEGDLICVTGSLGGSTAGLKALLKGIEEGSLGKHLEPKARLYEESNTISHYARAMIDVSDGLGSEVTHICRNSGTGALIFKELIPLSDETKKTAVLAGEDPYDCALYGGEDFELVFTIDPGDVDSLRYEFRDFSVVGEIRPEEEGVHLIVGGKKEKLKKGYDHFA